VGVATALSSAISRSCSFSLAMIALHTPFDSPTRHLYFRCRVTDYDDKRLVA
jgi:hypothetical protein